MKKQLDETVNSKIKAYSEDFDRSIQTTVGKLSGGLSPAAFILAFFDWYSHLLLHPAKQFELLELMQKNNMHIMKQFIAHVRHDTPISDAVIPKDKRFKSPEWQQFPFSLYYESFLLFQAWWRAATNDVRGVSKHHEEVVDFTMKQILNMLSPSNFPLTNPEIIQTTLRKSGKNLLHGLKHLIEDIQRYRKNEPPAGAEAFVVGKDVAITPGKVIYRNHLIELIQYEPTTDKVYAEPVLITPAWIMKYYILDLSPKHSLVKYLVSKGHTVFMISWRNPTADDRDLGMQAYLNLGVFSALDIVSKVVPKQKIHLVGYCLGGTLSAIATATLARDGDKRLASLTLLAAQTDFTEPGELGLFIDEGQISFLENSMADKGYLDSHQMSGAFQLLRSSDLIWSKIVNDYFLGTRQPLSDVMAWNADATRLPYKMHSEYLRQLFLNNALAEGKYIVNAKPITLNDIHLPIFVVGTERDHVSPWRSVFKVHLLTKGDITFALTSGGHNVGIVSIPVKNKKLHYRISTLKENEHYIDPDTWYETVKPHDGSWWPAFENWLKLHSSKKMIDPPSMGNKRAKIIPLDDAPGSYVLQK